MPGRGIYQPKLPAPTDPVPGPGNRKYNPDAPWLYATSNREYAEHVLRRWLKAESDDDRRRFAERDRTWAG
jgi:hypothetical protein